MFWMMIEEPLNKEEIDDLRRVLTKVKRRTGKNSWIFQNAKSTPDSVHKGREHGVREDDQNSSGSSTESTASSSV